MTETRDLRVILGDWSLDGHHVAVERTVRVSGEDVSDAALRDSFQRAMDLTGLRPTRPQSPPDDARGHRWIYSEENRTYARLSDDVWEALDPLREAAGMPDPATLDGPYFRIGDSHGPQARYPLPWAAPRNRTSRDYGFINSVDLYMLFVGYGLDEFAWEIVDPPRALLGGEDPICGDAARSIGYWEVVTW